MIPDASNYSTTGLAKTETLFLDDAQWCVSVDNEVITVNEENIIVGHLLNHWILPVS